MRPWIAALAACMPLPALAQPQCAPREDVVALLSQQHGESVHSIAIEGQGGIVEMWANAETGTWTLTLTRPDGITCLVGHGHSFEAVSQEPAGMRL